MIARGEKGPMIVYKIRTKDGLFSQGGTWLRFNKRGKVWKRRGDLTCHLNNLRTTEIEKYERLEAMVVEYELVERETGIQPLACYIAGVQNRKALKEQERERFRAERLQKERRQQYEELKKEFGER